MINVNMTDKAGVTLATAGKYCADNVKVTPSADILRKDEQAKTATPTTSAQDITPDAGKALSKVTVNPITAAIVGDLDADSFASSIVAAIEGKGVDVPSGAKIDALAALVEAISAGGGAEISSGKFFIANTALLDGTNPYCIEHGLGKTPDFAIVVKSSGTSDTASFAAAMFVATDSFSDETKQAGLSYFSNESSNNMQAYTKPSLAKNFTQEYGCLADETYIKIYGKTGSHLQSGWHSWMAGVLI